MAILHLNYGKKTKMKKNKACPKCSSENIKIINYMGVKCIICDKCGYDETSLYEVYPGQKTSNTEKMSYSPYKAGGPKRARKLFKHKNSTNL